MEDLLSRMCKRQLMFPWPLELCKIYKLVIELITHQNYVLCASNTNEQKLQIAIALRQNVRSFASILPKLSWKLHFVWVEGKEWGGKKITQRWECLEKKLRLMLAAMWWQWWALFAVPSPLLLHEKWAKTRKEVRERERQKTFSFFIHTAFKTEKMEIERPRQIQASLFSPKVGNRLIEV